MFVLNLLSSQLILLLPFSYSCGAWFQDPLPSKKSSDLMLLLMSAFPGGLNGTESVGNAGETWVRSLGQDDLLEKGMAAHSSILSWRIPWTEEPGGLQSIGSQRVRHD